MSNNVLLVGRMVNDVTLIENDGKKLAKITISVSRPFKNEAGIYEIDFIDCILWSAIAENTAEYCHKGDIIGVKGRLQSRMEDNHRIMEVIADKVSFLSSKSKEENNEETNN